jgi:hypothetical protein
MTVSTRSRHEEVLRSHGLLLPAITLTLPPIVWPNITPAKSKSKISSAANLIELAPPTPLSLPPIIYLAAISCHVVSSFPLLATKIQGIFTAVTSLSFLGPRFPGPKQYMVS